MPTAYELMEAYRAWWRASYSTTPNSQAVIIAAAWAEHVLATYRTGQQPAVQAVPMQPTPAPGGGWAVPPTPQSVSKETGGPWAWGS
jgi:hypothetical protein